MGKDLGNSRSAFSEGLVSGGKSRSGSPMIAQYVRPEGLYFRPIPNPREGFRHIENLLFLSSLFGKRCTTET
jgi:hypothetical protein